MTEEPNPSDLAPDAGWDVYLCYRVEDEALARALRGQLKRRRPGLTVWAEKSSAGIGNGFNQDADEALSQSDRVVMLWTPARLASAATTELEAMRALTLQKPVLNVSAGIGDHPVPSPFARFRTNDVSAVAQLAGRSPGWGQPPRPDMAELDRQVEPVARWVDQTPPADPALADTLLSAFARSAGWAGSRHFEAVAETLARGDRSSAVELLLNAGYDTSRIDQIISPVRLRLADTRKPRPPWGAWRLEPRTPAHTAGANAAWLWAGLGFVACGLLSLSLWLLASVLGSYDRPSAGASGPARAPLGNCERASDGRIENAPCTLREANGAHAPEDAAAPLPVPEQTDLTREERPAAGSDKEDVLRTATIDAPPESGDTASPARNSAAQAAEQGERWRDEAQPATPPPPSHKPEPDPPPSAQTAPDTTPPTKSAPSLRPPAVAAPAIDMPAQLDPCETRRKVPCRLTVAKTGLWTLREVAGFYYGTPRAWCRIYRANPATFAGRASKRGGDEACISLNDTLDLPPRTDSGNYSLAGCPAGANPSRRCE